MLKRQYLNFKKGKKVKERNNRTSTWLHNLDPLVEPTRVRCLPVFWNVTGFVSSWEKSTFNVDYDFVPDVSRELSRDETLDISDQLVQKYGIINWAR